MFVQPIFDSEGNSPPGSACRRAHARDASTLYGLPLYDASVTSVAENAQRAAIC